ncbi:MAG TPA: TIGR03619 family F420-dependent LLM class oxidoreductase [Candidatus Limnocylindria bacterium]|nr:TIGR03619 family F420-dependent LLM class oxidoreductase [Candidatus Limnocylindria bacterium]
MPARPAAVQIVPPGRLAVGLQLPVAAQSTIFAQPWERDAGVAELTRVAQTCDRAGFFYVAVCDHVCVPRAQAAAMSTVWWDTVATLGFLAAATTRVRLLSYVYVPAYRHPLQTAKAFLTLDALSGGRVILGAGAGHLAGEFETLGVPFEGRGARLDEALDAIVAAFLDEFPRHEGALWSFQDVGLRPRPVQQPRPPVWIGGNTPAALRRAAARGDGWLPQGTFRDQLPGQIATIRAHRRKVRGDEPIEIGANSPWLYLGTPRFDVGPNTLAGSADAVVASLLELRALGVSHCGVRFRSRSCDELCEQIEAFAADVLPHLG